MVEIHRWHFIEFTPKHTRVFTDREGATDMELVENPERYAVFVCEVHGEIKKVLTDKTQLN